MPQDLAIQGVPQDPLAADGAFEVAPVLGEEDQLTGGGGGRGRSGSRRGARRWLAVSRRRWRARRGSRAESGGDGVADQKELLYKRGSYGRGNNQSVEHQDSGLIWNLDNHIYISYNIERYRFTDGTWKAEKQRGHWTQWGLTHNEVGDVYWAHNSDPVASPYLHPRYWGTVQRLAGKEVFGTAIDMGKPYAPDFMKVKSLCLLNDRGGSAAAMRSFTSAATRA